MINPFFIDSMGIRAIRAVGKHRLMTMNLIDNSMGKTIRKPFLIRERESFKLCGDVSNCRVMYKDFWNKRQINYLVFIISINSSGLTFL